MAGDWIKMRTDLYRDPKVCLIADALLAPDGELARFVNQNLQRDMAVTRNVTRNVTVGALVTVWGVMRQRGKRSGNDLFCPMATLAVIDDMADMPGFGHAMESVGWAIEIGDGVVFPHFFDDYNVDPAEQKSTLAAERQRRYRERQKAGGDANSDVTRDVTVTHREEKSREELKAKAAIASPVDFKADLFARWKALPDGGGGAFLNKLFRDHKPELAVIEAVERTLDESRADPKAFVLGILRAPAQKRVDGETLDELMARAI